MAESVLVCAVGTAIIIGAIMFSSAAYSSKISPVTTYVVPWVGMVMFYQLPFLPWRFLEVSDYRLILLSLVCYILGALPPSIIHCMSTRARGVRYASRVSWEYSRARAVIVLLFLASLVGTVVYLSQLLQVVKYTGWNLGQLNAEFMSGRLRRLGLTGRLVRASGVIPILTLLCWDLAPRSDRMWLATVALFSSLINFLSTRRATGTLLVTWIVLTYVAKSGWNTKSLMRTGLAALFTLIWWGTLQIGLNKLTAPFDSVTESVAYEVLVYITGNMDTLRPLIERVSQHTHGMATLYPVGIVLSRIAPDVWQRPDLSIPFNIASIPFNTTPYLYYAFLDFGLIGLLLIPYVFGFISTILYVRWLKNKEYHFGALSTLSMTAGVYSIRQNSIGEYDLWFWAALILFVSMVCKIQRRRGCTTRLVGQQCCSTIENVS